LRALVVHYSLNPCGGAERVAVHVIAALQEMGFDVELAVAERTEWRKVSRIVGARPHRIPGERLLIPAWPEGVGLYGRVAASVAAASIRGEYDLVVNTHGDMLVAPADIYYCNFPEFALLLRWLVRGYEKYRSGFWRAYFEPYRASLKAISGLAKTSTVVLANSGFTARAVERYMGRRAVVVYPPVEVSEYAGLPLDGREDLVVSIARLQWDKMLHLVPHIARLLRWARFAVIGSTRGPEGREVLEHILSLRDRLGLDNLEVYPDAPHEEKLKILGRAKAYLHLKPFEHFGISVAEAMAAGLVPVVHTSGGAWEDIAGRGAYGVGFESHRPEEVAGAVARALKMWSPRLAEGMRERTRAFSDRAFRERVKAIARTVLKHKF